MKTKTYLMLLALTAAALSLNVTTVAAQESLKNRAVAASPRAKEVFPWLTRAPSLRIEACYVEATAKNELTQARNNRAFAASPRVLEQFPELARSKAPRQEFTIAPLVEKNPGVFANPRAKEQFPELRFLSPATAKGGASKLMELGK